MGYKVTFSAHESGPDMFALCHVTVAIDLDMELQKEALFLTVKRNKAAASVNKTHSRL